MTTESPTASVPDPMASRPGGPIPTLLPLLAALLLPPAAWAQEARLEGRVVQPDGDAVSYARVVVAGTPRGVHADSAGRFELDGIAPGEHVLEVSAQGYAVARREVSVPGSGDPVRVVLDPDPVGLETMTVTGTRKRESVGESAVKVEVVPQDVLGRNATNSLGEAIQYQNGLYNQIDCGVCYTNSIRINGMEGPYTSVLIDGMPIMSSLASVYGLNGINPALIERIEIIKGPASTLYGSDAMGGVINVITKDPRFAPRLAVDVRGTTDGEANLDFAYSSDPGDVSGFVSGNVAYNDNFVDDNGDGFSDVPLVKRGTVTGKLNVADDGERRASVSAKVMYEDRFGGVRGWEEEHRGTDEFYGESIYTERAEVLGEWKPAFWDALRVEGSFTHHEQDSYYGTESYDASQQIAFANVLWGRETGSHDLLVGATARYKVYDDDTPATSTAEKRLVPGLLVQDDVSWTEDLTTLGGLRTDHHEDHGLIASPRLAVKWEPFPRTALRLNAGTGFRVVDLFTEDHAALTGSREVVIADELRPERSRSVTLNVNQVIEIGPSPMMIDLDLFHTRFSNKIVPDYDQDPDLIVYENLSGHAVSRGVSLSLNQNVDYQRFLYELGVTLKDVYEVNDGAAEDEFYAPSFRAVASATWNVRSLPLSLDYTGRLTGPMRLPDYEGRSDRSPTYSVHNLQATWQTGDGTELYLSVKNLFDYAQPTPLVNPDRPFSDAFDTAYVYGPLRGRRLMAGFRYAVEK